MALIATSYLCGLLFLKTKKNCFRWGLNPRCPRYTEQNGSCCTYNYKHGALTTMLRKLHFNPNCLSYNIYLLVTWLVRGPRIDFLGPRKSLLEWRARTPRDATKDFPCATTKHCVRSWGVIDVISILLNVYSTAVL